MKVRVGIVGLGDAWETRHRQALRALSDRFEVRAICAAVAHRADLAAREFNAVSMDGFRALAAREDIDAILMLSQDWIGPLPILAACEAGKAVYTSVALEIDPVQAREVKRRVETSGVAFMAEFPRRHAPATLRLKELVATKLGQPRLLFCHDRRNEPPTNGRTTANPHCPPSIRQMMELVDWCRYVVGTEPTSVVGMNHVAPEGSNLESDYQMMSLDFSLNDELGAGAMAQISCSSYMSPNWPDAIGFRAPAALQVCCENGVAFVDLPSKLVWFDEAGQHLESLESERSVGEQLLTQFYRAVTSLVRNTTDLEDAYRALNIVLTARTSFQESRRLPLEF